ncbi:MAG: hypothetical protein ACRD8Z_14385, partial [Nitrososphaeraceae archaeon]
LITFCRKEDIPIFYTEAVRERSGIDLLTNIHMILPRRREERLKVFFSLALLNFEVKDFTIHSLLFLGSITYSSYMARQFVPGLE